MAKISIDESDTSVVVTCNECTFWYAFAWTRDEGYQSGANHQVRVHDMQPHRATEAGRKYRARHAVAS